MASQISFGWRRVSPEQIAEKGSKGNSNHELTVIGHENKHQEK